ncbi:MAG: Helicase-related protein [Parcubacteria bacterium C7867-006]|nr:MAG: Helicase-related protein [Parcubacteria bacterium C7867-006]
MKIKLPPLDVNYLKINENTVSRRIFPSKEIETVPMPYNKDGIKGFLIKENENEPENNSILVVGPTKKHLPNFSNIIRLEIEPAMEILANLNDGEWLSHPQIDVSKAVTPDPTVVINSWDKPFTYQEENNDKGVTGLRSPQIGALHAIHSHWTVSNDPATIVMPTGTGKTETMLSALVSKSCTKVLIIVPTDALRSQLANKFRSLGILKELGVVPHVFEYPYVGVLKTKPQTIAELDQIFNISNVIVTTIHIAGQLPQDLQERMAVHCPYLFIDEAHHIAAQTWRTLKEKFKRNKILQFTATPFRNDDLIVDGKIIFKYPLRLALKNGYFKKIHFKQINEFDETRVDIAIAEKAIAQLREDNPKHILMARVGNTAKAEEVFKIYDKYPEFNPVQIHTGIKSKAKRLEAKQAILSGKSRIVVCVDMLGEGFDLPELKIAAFHDIRKSLAVTLQLAGRFTRARSDLGEATFIANVADLDVRNELKRLYEQDSDWNALLEESSEQAIGQQQSLQDFAKDFVNFPDDVPLRNIYPATSTAIYKTDGGPWHPENFEKGISGIKKLDKVYHSVNPVQNTLVIVTAQKVPVDWIKVNDVFNWDWELYILFWDSAQKLLFIHSSSNAGYYQSLAEAICGTSVELITESKVFRALSGINRLKLYNVGLKKQLGRLISFTSHAGSDVGTGISEAQKTNVIKSNIFGVGYEKGEKVSIGCSRKGRIWSRRVVNVEELAKWFSFIGKKILDETIDTDEILKGTLRPKPVSARPAKVPIRIDWPHNVYSVSENECKFDFGDGDYAQMHLLELELKNPSVSGDIEFSIASEQKSIDFTLTIKKENDNNVYKINKIGMVSPNVRLGSKIIDAEMFLYVNPPTIWFADGSSLEGNIYTELNSNPAPFPDEKIDVWDWTGVDIKKESQGVGKDQDSIQYKVIEKLKNENFDVIINDDGKGEAADVVAIRIVESAGEQNYIEVNLYHCKYSGQTTPGSRISDLYEVCGQAQRSAHWKEDPYRFFSHFLRREPLKRSGQEISRFEKGAKGDMDKIIKMSEVYDLRLSIFIVQPGVSKAVISVEQRKLLAVTESYLLETLELPFRAIISA